MAGLSPLDGWALAAILAKAGGYGAALLAMGAPLFLLALPGAPAGAVRLARRLAICAALAGLAVLALQFGIRAIRISGMGVAGAVDPVMLGIVWDSPLGAAALWRGAGEVLVMALALETGVSLWLALAGALSIAASYTFAGHATGEPRLLLAALLGLHLLAIAFWVAALAPLRAAADDAGGSALLHRFGRIAMVSVPTLIVAGLGFAWLMTGSPAALVTTAYGWVLLAKLAAVAGLLALGALNKWRLVPRLASGDPAVAPALRRSILIEMFLVAAVLLATATLTSVTTPPVNL